MKYHLVIWKICGLWNWEGRPQWYPAYSAVITLLFYVLFPLGMFVQLFFTTDIVQAIQTCMFLFTAMCGLKLYIVMRQRPLIFRIFNLMHKLDGFIGNDDDTYRTTIAAGVRRAQFMNFSGATINFTTTTLLYLSKLIVNDGSLIWQFYFPFDHQRSAYVYHSVLFYQFAATIWNALVHSSIDALGGSMYTVIGSHLDVLGKRASNLGVEQSKPMYFNNVSDFIRIKRMQLKNEKDLIKCIETHKLCAE